ncbi:MAG TPA: UDP-N-acetylmuramoyl-L-alanyl-D-glutamate--2,6-diaminopimelate ligase [Acidisarcina sp.]|nr:UDP-N-acetylmuramoyl-L-alanyl-D-glutamate--2,6-diaminopimelate ligase [Acidisarcina sp.]
MKFDELLSGVEFVLRRGGDTEISGVEYDSRRVRPGSLFVAMKGGTTDGNQYLKKAIAAGAVAVVTDSGEAFDHLEIYASDLAVAEVERGRPALEALSANFFRHPEKKLALSGVTGTNGKTTTAFLLDAMLNAVGRTTVLVGTIEYHVAGEVRPSPHTTPESRDLLELFAAGVAAGATEAVMEVSSHALQQGRVFGIGFDVAIFTNLTRDHLDYHRTMEKYFSAKAKLFDGSQAAVPRVAVLNIEDPYGVRLAEIARAAGSEVFAYGLQQGDFRADDLQMAPNGMSFSMQTPGGSIPIRTRLTGRVNVQNLLAAAAAALARGLKPQQVTEGAAALACVPGRFQTVDRGQPFTVVVDYAHTDDALRNLTALAREFVATTGGRVITLFGCGGDRDRTKRPLMGRAAGEGSDFVVLTSDNPRSEEPEAILADVLPGLQQTGVEYQAEPDRTRAIHLAVNAARAGDIVLLAGKGHEKVQILAGGAVPFEDAAVASQALADLGYSAEAVQR